MMGVAYGNACQVRQKIRPKTLQSPTSVNLAVGFFHQNNRSTVIKMP